MALFSWSWFDFFIKIQQSSDVKFTVWALDLKFQIRLEIFDLIFFLWLLISYQTSKLRPKINVWKKKSNQWQENKIMLKWFDLKFTVGPYMIYFCCFWCKIILTVDFHVTGKEGLNHLKMIWFFLSTRNHVVGKLGQAIACYARILRDSTTCLVLKPVF